MSHAAFFMLMMSLDFSKSAAFASIVLVMSGQVSFDRNHRRSMEGNRFGGEGSFSPESRESEATVFLTPEQIQYFKHLSDEVYVQPSEKLIDADFNKLNPEQQKGIEGLEEECRNAQLVVRGSAAKSRLQLLGQAVQRAAEFLDLDTKEKIMSAALEVIPYVGLAYAFFGKRVVIEKDSETGRHGVSFEDLSMLDRVIYLAGEVVVSGHALRGLINSIKREGWRKVAVPFAKKVAQDGGQLLVRRVKQGVERELGALPGKGETSGQDEE